MDNLMQRIQTQLLILATLATLGFSFALVGAREANAQVYLGRSQFPRVNDLWNVRMDRDNFVAVNIAGGGQASGCRFSIQPDSAGRIPVLTSMTPQTNLNAQLWVEGNDGLYRILFTNENMGGGQHDLPLGIPLAPGNYMISSTLPPPYATGVALTGYWANP